MSRPDFRLGRRRRLSQRAEFRALLRRADYRASGKGVRVLAQRRAPDGKQDNNRDAAQSVQPVANPPSDALLGRLGLVVPKRALPKAVQRNAFKRHCRELVRQSPALAGYDLVVQALPGAPRADAAAMRAAIAQTLQKLTQGLSRAG